MAGVLDRLGRSAVRHHWWFIGAWLVAAVLVRRARGQPSTARPATPSASPGAQSQQALDLLEPDFPSQAGATATVVFRRAARHRRPAVQPAIRRASPNLEKIPHVTSVGNRSLRADRQRVHLEERQDRARHRAVRHAGAGRRPRRRSTLMQQATHPAADAGVRLAFGGAVVDYADQPPSGNADLIGLLAAVVILLFAFGSVVAMGLPILTALFGLGVGIALDQHRRRVHRHRHARARPRHDDRPRASASTTRCSSSRATARTSPTGMTIEAAVGRSVATAGSAVLFAGMHGGDRDLRARDLGHPVRRPARLHGRRSSSR